MNSITSTKAAPQDTVLSVGPRATMCSLWTSAVSCAPRANCHFMSSFIITENVLILTLPEYENIF